MTRILMMVAALGVAAGQPAGAQQMMRMLERGPVGYLHGHTLVQTVGNLTAGDFSHPALADWDGDGDTDLVVGSGYGDLLLFERVAGGAFNPARALTPESEVRLDAAPQRCQVSPWLGDLDDDGSLDLLLGIADRVYRYRVTAGSPGGGVALIGEGGLPRAVGPVSPCVMDCDGDGVDDLVITDGRGQVLWLPLAAGSGYGLQALTAGGAPITVSAPARPCAADWDGDGRTDLLVGDAAGVVTLLRGTATGLAAPEPLGGGETRWIPGGIVAREAAPWAADWDGDGDIDLLLGCRRGFVMLVERLESSRLQLAGFLQQAQAPVDAGRCAVAAPGDWDGDGDVDLVVGGEDGYLTLYERLPGEGIVLARGRRIADDRGLVRAEAGDTPGLRYAAPARPCAADWDGDGRTDLLVGDAAGVVT
ncbi:MAG: VCBS repeat-containing protein, partial [Armatimonadetes bacterium]|nr:VCBS repeat-containing protein [Armatimonadota bacterium]